MHLHTATCSILHQHACINMCYHASTCMHQHISAITGATSTCESYSGVWGQIALDPEETCGMEFHSRGSRHWNRLPLYRNGSVVGTRKPSLEMLVLAGQVQEHWSVRTHHIPDTYTYVPWLTFCFLQVDLSAMSLLSGYMDVTDSWFVAAVLSIAFNPLFWNLVCAVSLSHPIYLPFIFRLPGHQRQFTILAYFRARCFHPLLILFDSWRLPALFPLQSV